MKTITLTIKKIKHVDKWTEFWFEEKDFPTVINDVESYQLCSKTYKFHNALEKAGFNKYNTPLDKIIGLKMIWEFVGVNWEIDSIFDDKINAENILKKYENPTYHYADQDYDKDKIINAMKEFAAYHVKQALIQASEDAYCSLEHPDNDNGLIESTYIVAKHSILRAYPKENIV